MVETALAMKCFVAGVTGVFLVMIFLQVALVFSSKLAIWIETTAVKKSEPKQEQG